MTDLSLVGVGEEAAGGETRKSTQDGFYAQAVYGFAPRFTLGLRYDVAGMTNRIEGGEETESYGDSRRWSANLTFNPTEFSRFRVAVHSRRHLGRRRRGRATTRSTCSSR